MTNWIACLSALPALCVLQPAQAQQIEHGMTVQRGWFNARAPIEPIQIKNTNGDQIKGMKRVAISVFNVAFPNDYHLKVTSNGSAGSLISHRSSELTTRLTGIDLATRQRLTDAAYADFVGEL